MPTAQAVPPPAATALKLPPAGTDAFDSAQTRPFQYMPSVVGVLGAAFWPTAHAVPFGPAAMPLR